MLNKIFLGILFLSIWIGFVGPYCISSNHSELVIGWIAVSLFLIYLTIHKTIKGKIK